MIPLIPIALQLAQFAPQVVKWVTGSDSASAAATAIVGLAQQVTKTTSPDEALEVVRTDPSAALAFKQAVLESETDLDKAFLVDRQDARKRDVAYVTSNRYNWRGDLLAVLAVGGLIGCVYLIARDTALPERAVNAIMFVAGVLASCARDVYGFEFGSSRGSKEKDAVIQQIKSQDKNDVSVSVPSQSTQTVSVAPAREANAPRDGS